MSTKGLLRPQGLLPTMAPGKPRNGRASAAAAATRNRGLLQGIAAALAVLLVYQLVAYQLHQGAGLGPFFTQRQTTPEETAAEQQAAVVAQQRAARESMAAAAAAAAERPWDGYLPEPPPKVALLFLVRGTMPLEPVWQEFFEAAAQLEPVALPPEGRLSQVAQQRRRRLADVGVVEAEPDSSAAGDGSGTEATPEVGEQQQQAEQQAQEQQQLTQQPAVQQEAGTATVDQKAPTQTRGAAASVVQDEQLALLTQEQRDQLMAQRRLWIALASDKKVRAARRQALKTKTMEAAYSMMSPVDPDGPIARQDLFSVYVHTLPGYYFNDTSVFSGYQIDRRVFVFWGQYSVAEAERRLLAAALGDPRNQRFLLLSETCTPLYPPHVLYSQLLSETKSRVNACAQPDGKTTERWHSVYYIPGLLTPSRWRKGSQWKSLLRHHAELVVGDTRLQPRFERECYSFMPPTVRRPPYIAAQNRTWVHRSCIADEHYIPSLLAAHELDRETTCADSLTVADWIYPLWSPKVHLAEETDTAMIRRLRKQRATEIDCDAAGALASAAAMFRRRGATTTLDGQPLQGEQRRLLGGSGGILEQQQQGAAGRQLEELEQQQQQRRQEFVQLGDVCFLFARKFSPETVPALLELAADCEAGTGLAPSCLPS